ncbi:MAG TPA: DHA2 family efflux MFS transporter permease subunit [Anaerolineae bacterium]|nr:DHA2 family efflux MFS transporter permease subunit [Anaerolineae bacterium]
MSDRALPGASEGAQPLLPANYKWRVLGTVIFGSFMAILDTTAVNVAFQTLRSEFGGSINDAQWVLSLYVLALGISTPLAGFLADRFGSKKVYLGGLALFGLGSLLCGAATSLPMLIVARGIQGVGGGIGIPLGTALLLQAFPHHEHGRALGIFGIAGLVAPALGPVLGGWLVDQHLWRVIFFINPPIALAAVLLGMRSLREQIDPVKPSFDVAGVVTEVIGFGAILYAASLAADSGWTSPATLTWFAVGTAGLIAFVLVELFVAKDPLLDLRLFRHWVFVDASLLGWVATVALFGAEFLMPLYLQSLRGYAALSTGLTLLPMALAGGVVVPISGRLYDRFGPRPLLAAGFAILMVNTWQLSLLRADTAISWILLLLVLRGIALGLMVQTTLVTALSVVAKHDLARGSSLTNATRLVVQSIGVAILATVLAGALSPEVQAMQLQMATAPGGTRTGICEPQAVASVAPAGPGSAAAAELVPAALFERACEENITGFERAYRLTFFLSAAALALSMALPGWPQRWAGRQENGAPSATH